MCVCSVVSDFCNPMDCRPARLLCPWNFPGKITGLGSPFLLQGISLTQGSSPCLLCWQADSLPLSHLGSLTSLSGENMAQDREARLAATHKKRSQKVRLDLATEQQQQQPSVGDTQGSAQESLGASGFFPRCYSARISVSSRSVEALKPMLWDFVEA